MISHIVFDHDGTVVDTISAKRDLYQGMREILDHLTQNNIKFYIWTARDRFSTFEILKDLDILHRFEDISTATDCSPKPDPQGLQEMLLGVSPEHVAVIGDSYTDIVGAKKYGAMAIGALWANPTGLNSEVLKEHGADKLCFTTAECLDLIKEII